MSRTLTEAARSDERVAARSPLRRLLVRPETGALVGAIALFVFFTAMADAFLRAGSLSTVLYAASTFGIMAVSVSLLMIGGEFDLSAGVMVTTSALVASTVSFQLGLNVWVGAAISLAVTLALGFGNGLLYVRTGLPSFIVTLGTFFMLAGANLGVTKLVTGNVATPSIADMDGFDSAKQVFAADLPFFGVNIKITVVWWLLMVAAATWLLLRTRAGNWIFAVGGAAASARAVGVPVARTKIGLFMGVAFTAWFSGMHLLFAFDSVQ
ncbi:MAG: ABC transporter permease, partial [Actinomadura sp.]